MFPLAISAFTTTSAVSREEIERCKALATAQTAAVQSAVQGAHAFAFGDIAFDLQYATAKWSVEALKCKQGCSSRFFFKHRATNCYLCPRTVNVNLAAECNLEQGKLTRQR